MMDSDCDYLLYNNKNNKNEENAKEKGSKSQSCPHCSKYPIQCNLTRCTTTHSTPKVSFERTMTGRMVPYVEVYAAADQLAVIESKFF